jgi:NADPH2:quinone reductase
VRGAYCREHGPPEVVKVEELPTPALEPGQVLVRASAAAVNFPDVLIVANEYQVKVPVPFVPGSEFAGTVTALGEGVTGLDVGDRVFGTVFVGAFAEEVAVGASSVTRIPDGVDERLAAAFGVAHRTAYHVLRSVARLQPGEELVVLGAGGGVGLAAVQLGAILGASVTAVASSPEKLAVAESEGATKLIDHRAGDLRQALREALPGGSDVVVDPVGGDLAEPALRSLRWNGRFVTVGYASGTIPRIPLNLVLLNNRTMVGVEWGGWVGRHPEENRALTAEVVAAIADGRLDPVAPTERPLEAAADVLRDLLERRAVGKFVLVP